MKKFYTLAAAAVVALGANAQLYFVGNGEGLAWEPGSPMVVNHENGKYTVTIKNLSEFKMSSAMGTWDEFNAAALYAAGLLDEANLGKPVSLELNGWDNNALPWKGDYTLVISEDLTSITATTTTPKPVGFTPIYLRGDMNGWLDGAEDATKALWQMETTDGITYWFDCKDATKIAAGTAFKIADADWSAYNYSAADVIYPIDEPVEWQFNVENNGIMYDEDYTGTIKIEIPAPRKNAQCTVYSTIVEHGSTAVEDITVNANAPKEYFNLQGVRVDNPENGLFIVRQGKKVSKVLVK